MVGASPHECSALRPMRPLAKKTAVKLLSNHRVPPSPCSKCFPSSVHDENECVSRTTYRIMKKMSANGVKMTIHYHSDISIPIFHSISRLLPTPCPFQSKVPLPIPIHSLLPLPKPTNMLYHLSSRKFSR